VVHDLFDAYLAEPAHLPPEHRERVEVLGARAVADYIAGMTDRFALREHARLTGAPAPGAAFAGVAPWQAAGDA
jgi:dGTPase